MRLAVSLAMSFVISFVMSFAPSRLLAARTAGRRPVGSRAAMAAAPREQQKLCRSLAPSSPSHSTLRRAIHTRRTRSHQRSHKSSHKRQASHESVAREMAAQAQELQGMAGGDGSETAKQLWWGGGGALFKAGGARAALTPIRTTVSRRWIVGRRHTAIVSRAWLVCQTEGLWGRTAAWKERRKAARGRVRESEYGGAAEAA